MESGVLAHKRKKERLKPMLDTFYATIGWSNTRLTVKTLPGRRCVCAEIRFCNIDVIR
jgi:hypothetical protein